MPFANEPEISPGVNAQTGTSYTILHSDREKLVTFSNASPVAVTIPQAVGAFGNGWRCQIQNKGDGTVTITPASGTIDGASSLALVKNRGVWVLSDGVSWQVEGDLNP